MTGHVTYACACLNIKIHLANKYILDKHQQHREQLYVQLTDPPLEGWQFDLGMGGVQTEYATLLEARKAGKWVTVGCLNCSTGSVFSLPCTPQTTLSYPIDIHTLSQDTKQVIVHRNTIYGDELDQVKERANYSATFSIVIHPDSTGLEDQEIPSELFSQDTQLRDRQDQSITQLRQDTEERIESFRKAELAKMEQTITAIKYDRETLWKKMIKIRRTIAEQDEIARRLNGGDHADGRKPSAGGHVRFMEEAEASKVCPTRAISSATVTAASGSAPGSSFSAAGKRFVLDENEIKSSVMSSTSQEQSHTVEPDVLDQEDTLEFADQNDDGMFALDEEIESDEEGEQPNETGDQATSIPSGSLADSHPLSTSVRSSWARKRANAKYIAGEGDEHDIIRSYDVTQDTPDEISRSVSKFATSMPISILPPEPVEQEDENTTRPDDQDTTRQTEGVRAGPTDTSQSFKGFDHFSFADREASRMFPHADRRRKSVNVAKSTQKPQLDTLVGQSLDTRSRRMSRTKDLDHLAKRASMSRSNVGGSGEEGDEAIVPPHILSAMTFTDETEAMFGAVPRSGTWRKPV